MRHKIVVRVLGILILLYSARYYGFSKPMDSGECFKKIWAHLRKSKLPIWLFRYYSDPRQHPYQLGYNDFLYIYVCKVLERFYGLRHPLIVSWDNRELFDQIVKSKGSCMVLTRHYIAPCTVISIASHDRDLATVAENPADIAESYRNYGILDMSKIEIIKVGAKCLILFAGAARKGKVLICNPEPGGIGRGLKDSMHIGFFEFSYRMRIPIYFAKYRVNSDGEYQGYLKGPVIRRNSEEVMSDFISFCYI